MLEGVLFQLHVTLGGIRDDVKIEIKNKLRVIITDFADSLNVIAEKLNDLEGGTLEIFQELSKLFLLVEKLYRLKDIIAGSYPQPQPFLPM